MEQVSGFRGHRCWRPGAQGWHSGIQASAGWKYRLRRLNGCPAQGLTAYHDIALDKCYVIELNTTIVLPPRSFWELLMNVKVSKAPSFPPQGGQAQGRGQGTQVHREGLQGSVTERWVRVAGEQKQGPGPGC